MTSVNYSDINPYKHNNVPIQGGTGNYEAPDYEHNAKIVAFFKEKESTILDSFGKPNTFYVERLDYETGEYGSGLKQYKEYRKIGENLAIGLTAAIIATVGILCIAGMGALAPGLIVLYVAGMHGADSLMLTPALKEQSLYDALEYYNEGPFKRATFEQGRVAYGFVENNRITRENEALQTAFMTIKHEDSKKAKHLVVKLFQHDMEDEAVQDLIAIRQDVLENPTKYASRRT